MKIIVWILLSIFGFISSAAALKDDVCGLEHSKNGDDGKKCRAYNESWSYNADTNECVPFIYGGCNGNMNRFSSREKCEEMCKE